MNAPRAAALLKSWDNILILTHKRPDGDTIGCAVALCELLRQKGKTAWLLPNSDATSLFTPYLEGYLAPEGFAPDHVVSTDIASESLFPANALAYLEQGIDLSIDHHPSNTGFARENWVEPDKAACGEILFRLCQEMGELTPAVALPLYVAVSTDTGCFQYSNTTPNTHRVAAELMSTGIDYAWVNKRHFRTKSYKRLRIEARMMETMELHDNGQIALAAISLADMASIQATEADVEDIAAVAGQLEGVRVSVTIRELRPGECKLSVRTGAGLNASHVCALLGGGGHAAAAGCTVSGTVADAKREIMAAIRKVQANG